MRTGTVKLYQREGETRYHLFCYPWTASLKVSHLVQSLVSDEFCTKSSGSAISYLGSSETSA